MLLRFDGVESAYLVWLNGAEVGVGEGSRLVQEFDVTELLVPGCNELAVRVHQWSAMSYVEDQDQWWLPGIFRDVTLLGRPRARSRRRVAAHRVRGRQRDGRSGASAGAFPVTVAIPELGVERRFGSAADVTRVRRREGRAVDGRDAAALRRDRQQPGRDRVAAAGVPHGARSTASGSPSTAAR